jgi:Arc/MetJ family transcription regulator
MRANIILDDELVREALKHSKARSKSGLVEEALRILIEVRSAEQRSVTYRKRLLRLAPRLRTVRLRERPAELQRTDRDRM